MNVCTTFVRKKKEERRKKQNMEWIVWGSVVPCPAKIT